MAHSQAVRPSMNSTVGRPRRSSNQRHHRPPPPDKPLTELTFDEENRRFAAITAVRRPTGNEVDEHEARLLELRNNATAPPPVAVPTPQPTQSTWAIGSMEWLAEENKSR